MDSRVISLGKKALIPKYWYYTKTKKERKKTNTFSLEGPHYCSPLRRVSSTTTSSKTFCYTKDTSTFSHLNGSADAPLNSTCLRTPGCNKYTKTVSPPCASWCVLAITKDAKNISRKSYICMATCASWCASSTHPKKRTLSRRICNWRTSSGLRLQRNGTVDVSIDPKTSNRIYRNRDTDGVRLLLAVFFPINLQHLQDSEVVARYSTSWDLTMPGPRCTGVKLMVVEVVGVSYGGVVIKNCHYMVRKDPSCNRDGGTDDGRTWNGKLGGTKELRSGARFVGRNRDLSEQDMPNGFHLLQEVDGGNNEAVLGNESGVKETEKF